jgi:hypothetical protein
LAILKRQGSREITIVISQRNWYFTVRSYIYWHPWHTQCSKLAAKDFLTAKFDQDTCNRYLMLGFVSPHIPRNTITNLDLRHSYSALRSKLVLPSSSTISNLWRREY